MGRDNSWLLLHVVAMITTHTVDDQRHLLVLQQRQIGQAFLSRQIQKAWQDLVYVDVGLGFLHLIASVPIQQDRNFFLASFRDRQS